jgi:hypothetical protein
MENSKLFIFDKGVVSDFDSGAPVGDLIKDLLNCVLVSYEEGTFIVKNTQKNTVATLSGMPPNPKITGAVEFEGSVLITLVSGIESRIGKLTIAGPVLTYINMITDPDSSVFQFSDTRKIKKIIPNRENEEVVGIYWNDGITPPKGIRWFPGMTIEQVEGASFAYEAGYANVKFRSIIPGALPSGSYFYACRMLSKSGSYTDWSMVMGPVALPDRMSLGTGDLYSLVGSKQAGDVTAVGVSLTIENIPAGFAKIEVAAFYAKQSDIPETGYIFYRNNIGEITTLTVNHTSGYTIDAITMAQALSGSYTVLSAHDMAIIRGQMALAGPQLSNDMPVLGAVLRNKITGVSVSYSTKSVEFDGTGDSNTLEVGGLTVNPVSVGITAYPNGEEVLTRNKYKRANGSNVTESIRFCGDFKSYKGASLSTVAKTAIRGETYRIGMVPVYRGKRQGVRWLKDIVMPEKEISAIISKGTGTKYNMNILLAKIGGIDITEFVTVDGGGSAVSCDLDGFHIVVAPREGSWISEGFIFPGTCHRSGEIGDSLPSSLYEDYGLLYAPSAGYWNGGGDRDERPVRINNMYLYYTPDRIKETEVIHTPAKMRIESQHEGVITRVLPTTDVARAGYTVWNQCMSTFKGGVDSFTAFHWSTGHANKASRYRGISIFQKYYKASTESGADIRTPANHDEINVRKVYDVPCFNPLSEHNAQAIYLTELANRKFINAYRGFRLGSGSGDNAIAMGYGCATKLIITEDTDVDSFASYLHNTVTVASERSGDLSDYGGETDAALSRTRYRSCWHYQEITLSILNEIKTAGGRFVFNDVEAFIGDAFIVPFSVNRIFRGRMFGEDDWWNQTQYQCSHAEIVPIQATVNNAMIAPDKWIKERALRVSSPDTDLTDANFYGIGAFYMGNSPQYLKMENLKSYSFLKIIHTGNFYYSLSPDIRYVEKNPCMVIWTNKKIPGEEYDTFMSYPVANYINLPGSFISINALVVDREQLIAFCDRGIAFLPVDERIIMPGTKEVEVSSRQGISRYDIFSLIASLKSEDFFSLQNTPFGFTWFDRDHLDWFLLAGNEAPVSIPSATKARKYFENQFKLSNHHAFAGIYSNVKTWYDPHLRELFISSIFADDTHVAFACNIEKKIFEGRRTSYARDYHISIDDVLYFIGESEIGIQDNEVMSQDPVAMDIVFNKDSEKVKEFTNLNLFGVTQAPDLFQYLSDLIPTLSQTPDAKHSFFDSGNFLMRIRNRNERSMRIERVRGHWLKVTIKFTTINPNTQLALRNIQIGYRNERY